MDLQVVTVIAIVALALLFDFTNGFHDAANSVATVVATRALPAKWAPAFAAFFSFSAYFVVGLAVANTVGKVVHSEYAGVAVIFSALLGAITWNYLTWYIGMPSSSSHALIGGLVGAGMGAGWTGAIEWSAIEKVLTAIIASPLVAFTVAFLAMFLVAGLQKATKWHDNHPVFKGGQLVSAAAVSFGFGANDSQKTIGVVAALFIGTGVGSHAGGTAWVDASGKIQVATWIPFAAYGAIALGLLYGGWKIIETMGLKITTLHANSGVAANIGAVSAIFGATGYGIPISTTHAAASSVAGAGVASGRGINVRVFGEMMLAWIITIPATSTLAFLLYKLTQLPTGLAWGAVGSVLFVLFGWIAYAMAHSISASDVEAEIPTEQQLDEHLPTVPHLMGHGPVE